jgi:hypothetical protein
MCSQDWSTHTDHFQCTKYRDAVLQDKPSFSQEEIQQRKEKFRYAFYLNQYKNHERSLQLEAQQREKAKTLINQLTEKISIFDPTIIEEAFLQLQEVLQKKEYTQN